MPIARPISRMVGGMPWVVICSTINVYMLSCRSLLGAWLMSSFLSLPETQECFVSASFRTSFQRKHTIMTGRRQDDLSAMVTLLFIRGQKGSLSIEYPMRCEDEISFEPGERNALLGIDQFLYEAEKDTYPCPKEETLAYDYTRHAINVRVYRADGETCNRCPLKSQCTTSSHGRTIHRNLREHYSERVRAYHQTAAYEKAMGKRKVWIEPLFAEAKQWHGMRRFRLRQLWRVNCEALMIASGQNLKRLLQKRGWGRRPFPAQAMALMPPESFEAETWSRNLPLKNQRASVAVASFASWGVVRGFFEAKINLFSLINGVIVVSAY